MKIYAASHYYEIPKTNIFFEGVLVQLFILKLCLNLILTLLHQPMLFVNTVTNLHTDLGTPPTHTLYRVLEPFYLSHPGSTAQYNISLIPQKLVTLLKQTVDALFLGIDGPTPKVHQLLPRICLQTFCS